MTVKQIAGLRWRVARDGKGLARFQGALQFEVRLKSDDHWGHTVVDAVEDDRVLLSGGSGSDDTREDRGIEAAAASALDDLDELISKLQDLRGVTAPPESPLVRALRKLVDVWDRRAAALKSELEADEGAEEVARCRAELEALL